MSQQTEEQFRVRPRFRLESPYSPKTLEEKIEKALAKEDATCKGQVIPGHVTLFLPPQEQHYWSPQLSLTFEETEAGSLIRGLYGPRPQVWTMFVLFYSIIGFAALIVLVFGFSYWSLNKPAGILWLVPVLAIIFLSLYLVAYYGQKLGNEQIKTLHDFIDDILK